MDVKGFKRKGVLIIDSHISIIWLLVVGGGYCLFPGVTDMPEKCNFTNLLCNESRLLKEDKIIIVNIANELRNRVAGGVFKYLNLQHDPVTDMNKLYWNEEIANKATMIVSSCPTISESFIDSQTTMDSGENGIDQIIIEDSIDPTSYQPEYEMPGCEVSSITYEEKLTQCAPQKIKERVIRFLSDYGLSVEGRRYDMRDFWIVNRFGEPKLTFRRSESSQLGCSFMVRISKTHYHAYLTCIHCSYNGSFPTIGHPGENCPSKLPTLDPKYENLCSDSKSEYDDIEDDQLMIVCKNTTVSGTDLDDMLHETTKWGNGATGTSEVGGSERSNTTNSSETKLPEDTRIPANATFLPEKTQSVVTSSCKTTIVERNKTMTAIAPISFSNVSFVSPPFLPPSEISTLSETHTGTGESSELISSSYSSEVTTISESTTTSSTAEKDPSLTTPEAVTSVYGYTASVSTFAIADMKTTISQSMLADVATELTIPGVSQPVMKDITGTVEQSTPVSAPITIINRTTLGATIISGSIPPTTTQIPVSFSSTLLTTPRTSYSSPLPTMLLITQTSSQAAGPKDFNTTCKTTYIPSNKTSDSRIVSQAPSASSISAIMQYSANTDTSSSTALSSLPVFKITSLQTTDTQTEFTTGIPESEKSTVETTMKPILPTTKKVGITIRKFMTRKRPSTTSQTSTEILSTSGTLISTDLKTIFTSQSTKPLSTASSITTIPGLTTTLFSPPHTKQISDIKNSLTPKSMSDSSIVTSKLGTTTQISEGLTISPGFTISNTTTTSGTVSEVVKAAEMSPSNTPKILTDHSTITSTVTTTCKTTILSANTSSTCKTTIPASKSAPFSAAPSAGIPPQIPISATSTTTYKTTIPTAKSSLWIKESTSISPMMIEMTPISNEMAAPISLRTIESTAMTTLPSTKFSSFSPVTSGLTKTKVFRTSETSSKMTDIILGPVLHKVSSTSIPEVSDFSEPTTCKTTFTPSTTTCKTTVLYNELTKPTSKISKTTVLANKPTGFIESSKITAPSLTSRPPLLSTLTLNDTDTTSTSLCPICADTTPIFISPGPMSTISSTTTVPISTHLRPLLTFPSTTTCRTTDISIKFKNMTCKTTFLPKEYSSVSYSTSVSVIISNQTDSEAFSSIPNLSQSATTLKDTSYEVVSYSSTTSVPTTTTCRTTAFRTSIMPSTTICNTTIPTTKSMITKTTCRTTTTTVDSTTPDVPTTTCRTTTLTSPTTTCRTTIPTSKLVTEKTSSVIGNFSTQLSTELNVPSTTTCRTTISTTKISGTTGSSTEVIVPTTTICKTTGNTSKSQTVQWSQWTSIPSTTTCRTTSQSTLPVTVSSSTCKTTVHQRQSVLTSPSSTPTITVFSDVAAKELEQKTSELSSPVTVGLTMSVATDVTTVSSESSKSKLLSTTSKSGILAQSILPTGTTYYSTIPSSEENIIDSAPTATTYASTTIAPSTTTCRKTLSTIKLSIPTTTMGKTTAITDARGSITTTYGTTLSTVQSATPTITSYITNVTSKETIPSTTTHRPTTVLSTTTSKTISAANITTPSTIMAPTITTCKTTFPITSLSPSTCKITCIGDFDTPTSTTSKATLSTIDVIGALIPPTTTCKTGCTISTTMPSTSAYSEILAASQTIIPLTTTFETMSVTNFTESSTTTCRTTLPSSCIEITSPETTTYRTTTISSPTTTCRTTQPSTMLTTTNISPSYIATSSCKTTIHPRKSLTAISDPVITSATPLLNISDRISVNSSLVYSPSSDATQSLPSLTVGLSSGVPDTSTLMTTLQTIPIFGISKISTTTTTSQTARVSIFHDRYSITTASAPASNQLTINTPSAKILQTSPPFTTIPLVSDPWSISDYSVTSLLPFTFSNASIKTPFTTVSPNVTISSQSNNESHVSLISLEDSTVTEQMTTKVSPTIQQSPVNQSAISIGTCKTIIPTLESTSTCKTTIKAHPTTQGSEGESTFSSSPMFSSTRSTLPPTSNSEPVTTNNKAVGFSELGPTIMTEPAALVTTTKICKTTIQTLEPITSTCKTTIPSSLAPSITICRTTTSSIPSMITCKSTIPTSTPASPTTTYKTTPVSILPSMIPTNLLPTVTTCRTTIPTSLPPSITTCKTTIASTLLPRTTTCRTTIPSILPTSTTTCKTTIPPFLPPSITTCRTTITTTENTSIIPTTSTCKTTIPTTFSTTNTCKTTIPTSFPTTTSQPPIISTILPIFNQTVSSFHSPISPSSSQVSSLLSSSDSISSFLSSASILRKPKNYSCKTTTVPRSTYPTIDYTDFSNSIENISIEDEHPEILTRNFDISTNFSTIAKNTTSYFGHVAASTPTSLTEGLSSKLSTFISSLLPSDWRSMQNLSTAVNLGASKGTDMTSIFLSSLTPGKDIRLFSTTPNLTTISSSTYVTDVAGHMLSPSLPSTSLSSSTLQFSTMPPTYGTTYKSDNKSTLTPINVSYDTSTVRTSSTVQPSGTIISKSTINSIGCTIFTTSGTTVLVLNDTKTESAKDIFDNRSTTAPPSLSKPKPCLCINWYLICLIFSIAFIFAWCLLCWQKMLL